MNPDAHIPRFFRLERHGAVGLFLLDKPPANTLDEDLHADLDRLVRFVEHDATIRAVVLGTANEKIFMAGAKLEAFPETHFSRAEAGRRVDLAQSSFLRVQRLSKPVIAAITGHALGGGCELAISCDFRVMQGGGALIGCPEVALGIIPGGGGTQRLPRLVGRSKATRMLLLGERLAGVQALEAGLVDELHGSRDETIAGALALGEKLAAMPSPGLRLIKRCLNDGYDPTLVQGLAVEREAAIEALAQPEAREGLQAFLEKRTPRFHG